MVAILEKHASNLEKQVAERTRLLTEEKKKTDALLYSMLPRYVCVKSNYKSWIQLFTSFCPSWLFLTSFFTRTRITSIKKCTSYLHSHYSHVGYIYYTSTVRTFLITLQFLSSQNKSKIIRHKDIGVISALKSFSCICSRT